MDTRTSRCFRIADTAEFHPPSNELRVDDRVARLRPHTGAVLMHLLLHPGRVISKEELLQAAWPGVVVTENSLAQCISEIRRELGGANQGAIETVPRCGYWFHPPPMPLDDDAKDDRNAPTTDCVEPALPRAAKPSERATRHHLRSLIAVFCVILIAGGAYWWHQSAGPSARFFSDSEQMPWLSMAVLPLAVDAEDAGQTEFAARVAEDLTNDLAQIPGVQVIARGAMMDYRSDATNPRQAGRELGVRYVVEGSVDRVAGQFLVNLHLIDAATGVQQWSDSVHMSTGMLDFDRHDVAGRLAQSLKSDLIESEIARLNREPPRSFDANDVALRAWLLSHRDDSEHNTEAQALARQAIALDPESLLAWRVLAASTLLDRVEASVDDLDGALERAEAAVRRALKINRRQPEINTTFGAIMAAQGRYAEALAAFDAELALGSRHDPEVHEWLGVTYLLMGKPKQAIQPLETAIWLSPRHARLSDLWRTLAIAYLHAGDLHYARDRAWSAVRTPRPSLRAYETLAAICTLYGDPDCAKEALEKLLRIAPGYTIAQVRKEISSSQPSYLAKRQEYLAALRAVGLPQ